MTLRMLYIALAAVGAAVWLLCLVPWMGENGLDLHMAERLLFANRVIVFTAANYLLTSLAVLAFAMRSGANGLRRWWVAALLTVIMGASVGLPVLMLLRESAKRQAYGRP